MRFSPRWVALGVVALVASGCSGSSAVTYESAEDLLFAAAPDCPERQADSDNGFCKYSSTYIVSAEIYSTSDQGQPFTEWACRNSAGREIVIGENWMVRGHQWPPDMTASAVASWTGGEVFLCEN